MTNRRSMGPFMPLFVERFLGATMHFDASEVGSYLLLLLHQWQSGYIEDDPGVISRVARTDIGALRRVLEKFDRRTEPIPCFVHPVLEEIAIERREYLVAQQERSRLGAEARRRQVAAQRVNQADDLSGTPDGVTQPGRVTTTPAGTPPDSDTNTNNPNLPLQIASRSSPRNGATKMPRGGGFKSWTSERFREEVARANDGLLTADEVENFIGYWLEPSSSGRPRFSLEKAWDTRRRIDTALRVVYEGRRNQVGKPRQRVSLGELH